MTNTAKPTVITIEATVKAPVDKVWKYWSEPEHIKEWNSASPDWHTPAAENDLRVGGKFSSTMAARDGSMSFDFAGEYTAVDQHRKIEYVIGDGRQVKISFTDGPEGVKIVESFDAEGTNPVEMQRGGWQSILNNFKAYAEAHA